MFLCNFQSCYSALWQPNKEKEFVKVTRTVSPVQETPLVLLVIRKCNPCRFCLLLRRHFQYGITFQRLIKTDVQL
jgi:thioredoxin-related protein